MLLALQIKRDLLKSARMRILLLLMQISISEGLISGLYPFFLIISILIWTFLICVFLSALVFFRYNIWLVFIDEKRELSSANQSALLREQLNLYTKLTEETAKEILKEIALLTIKPVIYAANVSEDDFVNGIEDNPFIKKD